MKKTSIFFALMTTGLLATAQVTRTSLYEEFTGENCPPCAATNPGLNTLLNANATKVIPIKWQVPIPSAPSATWSLYQTNKGEIDWRWKLTSSPGYGYPQTLSTPTAAYINSAPNGRMDGQELNAFGLTSNHPANLTTTAINNAQAVTTPFSISMNTTWDATCSNCVVDVTVTAASNFSAVGNLMYRLVLVEREVNFATAPGTNGEKDFADPVRKCYSTVASGTTISNFGDPLAGTWTAGQTQTLSINCAIPSYIHDKSEMAFVGFIQDDGNKKVWQAARTAQPTLPDDAKLVSITNLPTFTCSPTVAPAIVTFSNAGNNAITALTVTPYIDGVAQTPVLWTGNVATGATGTIATSNYPVSSGTHIYSVDISGVNVNDINPGNNSGFTSFGIISNYFAGPIAEPFTATTFPPTGWIFSNPNGGSATWSRVSTVGSTGLGCLKYEFYLNTVVGDADEMYLPPVNLTGVTNPAMTFDRAYTTYNGENDKLEVLTSLDCGATWSTVYTKSGSALQTAPTTTVYFTPTASQWVTEIVPLPSVANQSQVLVKFRATSDYGNNLYIDNVNLTQSTGVKNQNENLSDVSLYPNPANLSANLNINSGLNQPGEILIYNAIGQIVKSISVNLKAGSNEITISTSELSSGVYNVVLNTEKEHLTKKLTISK